MLPPALPRLAPPGLFFQLSSVRLLRPLLFLLLLLRFCPRFRLLAPLPSLPILSLPFLLLIPSLLWLCLLLIYLGALGHLLGWALVWVRPLLLVCLAHVFLLVIVLVPLVQLDHFLTLIPILIWGGKESPLAKGGFSEVVSDDFFDSFHFFLGCSRVWST